MTPQGCEQSGRISLAPLTIPSADMKVAVVNLRSFTYEQLSLSSRFLLFFFFLLSSKLLIHVLKRTELVMEPNGTCLETILSVEINDIVTVIAFFLLLLPL